MDPERLADDQAALRRVATLVARGASTAEVFQAVADEVARLLNSDFSLVGRYEADATLNHVAAHPLELLAQLGARTVLDGDDLASVVLRSGKPTSISYDDAPGPVAALARELGVRCAVGAPILVDDQIWGVMAAGWAQPEKASSEAADRTAEFTELVGSAIANAESREALARLAHEQASLRRVATLVASGVEPGALFDAIAGEVDALFGLDITAVVRFEDDGTVTVMGAHGGPHSPGARVQLDPDYVVAAVYRTQQAARFDLEDSKGEPPVLAQELAVRSALATPIVVEGDLWGAITIASVEGAFPPGTDRRLADFSALVATAIANTQARELVTALAEEQAALRRVATLVAHDVPPSAIFSAVSEEVARLFDSAAGVLKFEHGSAVTFVGVANLEIPIGTQWEFQEGMTSAEVHRTGRSARVEKVDWSSVDGPVGEASRRLGTVSAVSSPIVVEDRLWGAMTVGSRSDDLLPLDTEERLEKFTELIATAIANAETRAELAASRARIVATADATRRRIERDLHDGAQQQLVSLALEVRAAQAALPTELNEQHAELSRVVEGLTVVLEELREISSGIHPAILSEGGLAPALKMLARRSPIPVELDVRVEGRLPESVEVAAYYVVAEVLTNVAKHAHASSVQVGVAEADGALSVKVRDDGVGGADSARGSGLVGLRDRVETLGGTIAIDSPRGEGTAIDLALPLN